MLVGMALDPDWIMDMAQTYAKITVDLQTMLFDQEGYPDGIRYYEDMGYKGSPFMSPAIYNVRTLYTYDRAVIDQELESKIPLVKEDYNYVLHSDHSNPRTVQYETYKYFIKRGLELGTY